MFFSRSFLSFFFFLTKEYYWSRPPGLLRFDDLTERLVERDVEEWIRSAVRLLELELERELVDFW